MKKYLKNITRGFAVAATMLCATAAHAEPTNVCLGLLGDTSGSVQGSMTREVRINGVLVKPTFYNEPVKNLKDNRAEEYARMVAGMASALRHPKVTEKIIANAPVAISYAEFASHVYQRIKWKVLNTKEDVNDLADEFDNLTRTVSGKTNTYEAIDVMVTSITRDCPGADASTRRLIDLATDDKPTPYVSQGGEAGIEEALQFYRDYAFSKGVIINALAMYTDNSNFRLTKGYGALIDYLRANIVTAGGQVFDVENGSYEEAFVRKFSAEIAMTPSAMFVRQAAINRPNP